MSQKEFIMDDPKTTLDTSRRDKTLKKVVKKQIHKMGLLNISSSSSSDSDNSNSESSSDEGSVSDSDSSSSSNSVKDLVKT
ncbi:hypothetical protein ACF0H5_014667 [Mactra antiquata]